LFQLALKDTSTTSGRQEKCFSFILDLNDNTNHQMTFTVYRR
jgi:hypothetical protein